MSENIYQVYQTNPITTNASTDLMYFGQSPYGAGNDAAMTFANFNAQIVATGTLNAVGYYATAGNKISPIATANNGVLITSNTGLPLWLVNGTAGYVLTANSGASPSWQAVSSLGAITQINGDSGSATPSGGVLTISGGGIGLTTSGSASTLSLTGTLAIAHGGTAVTSVTIAPTATSFAGWDANSNMSANNFLPAYATTATAAGSTTLTIASAYYQFWTGSTTQTVILPHTGTVVGTSYYFVNNSTGSVTVEASGGQSVQVMSASSSCLFTCISAGGTTAASWNAQYFVDSDVSGAVLLAPTGNQVITTGNLTVSNGNLVAGSSGNAGTLASFPATASEGSLIIAAVNNSTGNFNTTISNASAVAQSQVVTIPDSGASTAKFILSTGAGQTIGNGLTLTTPNIGAATATSINFGGSTLANYVATTSWTPTVTFVNPGNLAVSYASQLGSYSRIGSIVVLTFSLTFTPTYTTASAQFEIAGLPFTSAAEAVGSIFSGASTLAYVGAQQLNAVIASSANYILIYESGTGTAGGYLSTTQFTSGLQYILFGSITYLI